MIPANIADVYLRERMMSKAHFWLEKALATANQRPSLGLLVLAANVAIADGDHKKAAEFYKKAAECGEFCPIFGFIDEYRKNLLALSKVEETQSTGEVDGLAIDTAIQRADRLNSRGHQAEAGAEYKSIYLRLAPGDKRRLTVRQSELSIERALAFQQKLKKILEEQGPAASERKMTAAEEEQNKVDNALAEIKDLTELEQIAVETHSDNQWFYWLGLAKAEVSANRPVDAKIHLKKLFKAHLSQNIVSELNIGDPVFLAIAISNQQNNNDGEEIVRDYIDFCNSWPNRTKSARLQSELELLRYYIGIGKFDASQEYMLKHLKGTGLTINDNGNRNWIEQIFYSTKLSLAQQCSLSRQFIDIEKSELPADAHLLEKMLDQLAEKEVKNGKFSLSIRDYLEAKRIQEKYTGLQSASYFEERLKPLLTITGDSTTLEILEQQQKRSREDVNPEYPYEHIEKSIDKNASPQQKIEQAEAEWKAAKAQAIYSRRSEMALDNLVKYTEEANEWRKSVDAHQALCDFFEHSDQTDAYFRDAHFNYWDKRIKFYLPTIDAYLKLNENAHAVAIIQRAIGILPDVSSFEFAEFGLAAIKCGDKELAEKLAAQSTQLIDREDYYNPGFSKLAALWKALGHEDKAASVTKLQSEKEAKFNSATQGRRSG